VRPAPGIPCALSPGERHFEPITRTPCAAGTRTDDQRDEIGTTNDEAAARGLHVNYLVGAGFFIIGGGACLVAEPAAVAARAGSYFAMIAGSICATGRVHFAQLSEQIDGDRRRVMRLVLVPNMGCSRTWPRGPSLPFGTDPKTHRCIRNTCYRPIPTFEGRQDNWNHRFELWRSASWR
jgi:hypothetical protein